MESKKQTHTNTDEQERERKAQEAERIRREKEKQEKEKRDYEGRLLKESLAKKAVQRSPAGVAGVRVEGERKDGKDYLQVPQSNEPGVTVMPPLPKREQLESGSRRAVEEEGVDSDRSGNINKKMWKNSSPMREKAGVSKRIQTDDEDSTDLEMDSEEGRK